MIGASGPSGALDCTVGYVIQCFPLPDSLFFYYANLKANLVMILYVTFNG